MDDFNHGWERHQAGDLRAAEEAYRRVLRAQPRHARAWFALGQLCQTDRRASEAIACIRQALEINPDEAEGHFLLGNLLLKVGEHQAAENAFRHCIDIRADHAQAHGNLGYVLGEQKRYEDAQAAYEQTLKLRPDLAEVHHNLGNVLREQNQYDRALVCYGEALRLRPDYGKAFINRGIALVAMGRLDEAIADLERGVRLKPNMPDAYTSLGAALSVQQRFDEALAAYDRALAIKPDHAEAGWNQSLIWLLRGEYERGWPAYEWRWKCKRTTRIPNFTQPRWDGLPLNGRTILLFGEQGLGDTLHFIRYAPLVEARGGKVLVQCQNALLRLLSRTPGLDGLIGWGATPPAFDVWIPLMSLPALFGTTLKSVPAQTPYIRPDPERVAYWRQQLAPVRGLRVGIAWQGSPRHAWDRHRSVTLDHFEPLARVPRVHLISLQKHAGSEQIRALDGRFPVLSLGDLVDEASGPFMDTAAILANLDLVISIDSSLAHLAGAMAVPTWLALTYTPDWRWLLERDDSVWYASVRLFRQAALGDWDGVFERMAMSLQQKAAGLRIQRPIFLEATLAEALDRMCQLEAELRQTPEPSQAGAIRGQLAQLAPICRDALAAIPELASQIEELRGLHLQHPKLKQAAESGGAELFSWYEAQRRLEAAMALIQALAKKTY